MYYIIVLVHTQEFNYNVYTLTTYINKYQYGILLSIYYYF